MQKLETLIEDYKDRPDTSIVHFKGDFDGYAKDSIADLQTYVDGIDKTHTLIFDFAKLNYLNSYAIGHLVAWHNHIKKLGGNIVIVGTNKNVEDIFAILGISTIFKIYPDLAAATSDLA